MSNKEKPRVYSYTRFSSPEQAKGDSERRQIEAAQKFAKSKEFVLDESLRMTDRGLSGFHGRHRAKGAFGEFLKRVEAGDVPRGSILLVENIDRLSREPFATAMETVFALLKHGITIATLSPADEFTTESVNGGGHWRLSAHIERAHAESKRKSDLASANWRQKRKLALEENKVLTLRAPAWLRLNGDGGFHLIPEAAEAVRLIFKLKLEGLGKFAIEKKLNQSAPWRPKNGWRSSFIEKILRTRAVLGEFQPHRLDKDGKRVPDGDAIPGYFPAVIEPETWHTVHSRMASNKGTGGRTGKATNVFQNLVRCGYCGGSMVLINKGDPPKGGNYLVCDNGRRGHGCSAHSVRYEEFEETMLNNLSKLRPESVLPKADEQAEQAKVLRNTIGGLIGELSDVDCKVENFIDQVGVTGDRSIRERYEKRIADLHTRRTELEAQKVSKEDALRELERAGQSFEKWQANLAGMKKSIAKDVDSRIRLKTHLKEFITKVEVFGKGHEDNIEHAEDLIWEHMPELAKAASYSAFRRYLRQRFLSPDGRFYTLYVKTSRTDGDSKPITHKGRAYQQYRPHSAGLQIAPISSLSFHGSLELGKGGWRFTGPKLDIVFKEFFDGRKPGYVPKASAL
jgi:DNA invertase Pin-like site-specific DNA recombinase